jgi:hypothetical protein
MDSLSLDVAGRPGHDYELGVWNPEEVSSVDGAVLDKKSAKVRIQFPGTDQEYVHSKVVFHLGGKHGL